MKHEGDVRVRVEILLVVHFLEFCTAHFCHISARDSCSLIEHDRMIGTALECQIWQTPLHRKFGNLRRWSFLLDGFWVVVVKQHVLFEAHRPDANCASR